MNTETDTAYDRWQEDFDRRWEQDQQRQLDKQWDQMISRLRENKLDWDVFDATYYEAMLTDVQLANLRAITPTANVAIWPDGSFTLLTPAE